jgi:hypothetical protein
MSDPFSSGSNAGGFYGNSNNNVGGSSNQAYRPGGMMGSSSTVHMRQPTPPQSFHVNTAPSTFHGQDPFGAGGGAGGVSVGGGSDGFYAHPASGAHSSQQQFFGSSAGDMRGASSSQDLGLGSTTGSTHLSAAEVHRTRFGFPEDDLPLLQELGVFPRHIQAKALAVLNPFSPNSPDAMEDMDLAGPVMFAIILAFLLSLQGKVQFSAIYGLSLLGIGFAKMLLTLMCDQHDVAVQFVVSTLGYCLLPNLVLAAVQSFQFWMIGSHTVILPVAFLVIGWSAWCATTMFVQALAMDAQRYLILYPCVLFYAVFAALTIF